MRENLSEMLVFPTHQGFNSLMAASKGDLLLGCSLSTRNDYTSPGHQMTNASINFKIHPCFVLMIICMC